MRENLIEANRQLATEGHRIIAIAYKRSDDSEGNAYENLTFLGLVALLDPPRTDVKNAILKCHEAGIRVIMLTGDQAETARSIAQSVGLLTDENLPVVQGKSLSMSTNMQSNEQGIAKANIFAVLKQDQGWDAHDSIFC